MDIIVCYCILIDINVSHGILMHVNIYIYICNICKHVLLFSIIYIYMLINIVNHHIPIFTTFFLVI